MRVFMNSPYCSRADMIMTRGEESEILPGLG